MKVLIGDKSVKIISLTLLIIAATFSQTSADVGLLAGAASRGLSGVIALESGFGPELGLVIPFSSFLELDAGFVFPRKYDVKDPQGQIFSDSDYYRVYSSMQYLSYTGGASLIGRFDPNQQWIPCAGLEMGRAVVFGSGKDGFSGLSIGWKAGLRYEFNDKWSFEIFYSRLTTSLSNMKLDGQKSSLENEVDVTCNSLRFMGIYWFSIS